MGMFDNIFCEVELPDGFEAKGVVFQTKSLECCLFTYTISKSKKLMFHKFKTEEVPLNERPYPDTFPFVGSIKQIPMGKKDTKYHGDIYFYTTDNDGEWREYMARFTEGKLARIIAVKKDK